MKDISQTHKQQLISNLISSKLEIFFPDGDCETITEENISSESMKLKQSISDENNLKFGGCIASEFDIDLINTEDKAFDNSLVGKWISVKLTQTFPSGENLVPSNDLYLSNDLLLGQTIATKEWWIFSGYIDSAKVNKSDKNMRNIVAYDVFTKLYDIDGTSLLMSILKSNSFGYTWIRNVLVKCLNEMFYTFGIGYNSSSYNYFLDEKIYGEQHLYEYDIKNDDWLKDNNTISIGEIIKNICEMIGTFGVIKPNNGKGQFNIIELNTLSEQYDFHENLYAEEYDFKGYGVVTALNGDSDRENKTLHAEFYDDEDTQYNIYDLTDNACCWQKWNGQGEPKDYFFTSIYLHNTGKRMYNARYTPMTATVDGRLWVEVGDLIYLLSNKTDIYGNYLTDEDGNIITETVTSYVLSRTLSGIHALTDEIESKGGNDI